jgi:hypothetical protein
MCDGGIDHVPDIPRYPADGDGLEPDRRPGSGSRRPAYVLWVVVVVVVVAFVVLHLTGVLGPGGH